MTETTTPSSLTPPPRPRRNFFTVEEIVLIIMVLFSLTGIVITDFSPADAFMYWMAMIFVFGLAALVAGWHHAKEKHYVYADGHMMRNLFVVQTLHWLGSLAAVLGVFSFVQTGRIEAVNAGLVILLMLGLATFLDGVRIGWRFSLAGIYLAVSAILINYLTEFLLVLLALALLLITATLLWEKYRAQR